MYKLVWFDYFLYIFFYFFISAVYRFALDGEQRRQGKISDKTHVGYPKFFEINRSFERLCRFCDEYSSLIPLTFVLAFYVSHVISRWWEQWNAIPWPDSIAFKVNAYVRGDVRGDFPQNLLA